MPVRSILLDTDFHKYVDDREALRMIAALHDRDEIEFRAVTTVTGNTRAATCATQARDALRQLGLGELNVYEGAAQPTLHRQSDFAHRSRLYGGGEERCREILGRKGENPGLQYFDNRYRGYALLNITPESISARLRTVDDIGIPGSAVRMLKTLDIRRGDAGIVVHDGDVPASSLRA